MIDSHANPPVTPPAVPNIDVRQALRAHYPPFRQWPSLLQKLVSGALCLFIKQARINRFLRENSHFSGFAFIEQIFTELGFSYEVGEADRRHIPATGAVIIVANHPLGGLDGLSLLHLVGSVRQDVKIVANQLLKQIDPLSGLFLAVDNMTGETKKQDIRFIEQALTQGQAVIFFPSGEVSRATPRGITDKHWNSGFLRLSERLQVPVLPVRIQARNSTAFYLIARLSQTLSMLCLPREMVQFSGRLRFYIGEQIDSLQIQTMSLSRPGKVDLIQRHVYTLGKPGKSPVILTRQRLSEPQDRQTLQRELQHADHLGQTADGKSILLLCADKGPAVLREIGRLREEAFRAVGEGTGTAQDIDIYDRHYRHIVLWDNHLLEIAGSYRLGEVWAWPDKDKQQLYSSSLFAYRDSVQPVFDAGLELGRSFVQPQFWGKRSLDYLWQGIGAYVARHPEVRYLFGPVSLSASLPELAKALLVRYYALHYPDPDQIAVGRLPYRPSPHHSRLAEQLIPGQDKACDFRCLREQLEHLGVKIPTLYKQYADLCTPGGVRFSAFNIDPQFTYCVDGLVVVDLAHLKDKKRQRYLSPHL